MPRPASNVESKIARCLTAAASQNNHIRPYFADRTLNHDSAAVLTIQTIERFDGDPERIAGYLHHIAANLNAIAAAHLDLLYGPQSPD